MFRIKEEKIFYQSTNGILLCGMLSNVNLTQRIVILCHGIRGNKDECGSFIKLTEEMKKKKINSFRFDFRAHDESSGEYVDMTISKEIEDLEKTIEMLKNRGYREFILLGASFGAGIVSLLKYEKYPQIKGLVCWYGALDYDEIKKIDGMFSDREYKIAKENGYFDSKSISSGKVYRFGCELFNEVYRFKPYENLRRLTLPILFVHGDADSLIPCSLSERICKVCNNGRVSVIHGGTHSFEGQKAPLQEAIYETVSFVKNVFGLGGSIHA